MTTRTKCPTCLAPINAEVEGCPTCGQAFCLECYSPVSSQATFCQVCGAAYDLYCPDCNHELGPGEKACTNCGLNLQVKPPFIVFEAKVLESPVSEPENIVEESYSGRCPRCQVSLYVEDGFCSECGQTFCTRCGQATTDEDLSCPGCGLSLYFDCPLCGFELTAETELCPNCNALFPGHCPHCQSKVSAGDLACGQCGLGLTIIQRQSARVVRSIPIGDQVVYLLACPTCGRNFNSTVPDCPHCGARVCSSCQLILQDNEPACPRCGFMHGELVAISIEPVTNCPTCKGEIPSGSTICPHCEQEFCPNCSVPIQADALSCQECGAEFELFCPSCESAISAETKRCPACGLEF
jgi:predicted amidophosphoribosyltransferase